MGKNPHSGAEQVRQGLASEPPAAFVFKTIADPYAGRISLFRVYSGVLKQDLTLVNERRETSERLGPVTLLQGRTPIQVPEIRAGDIGAVAKLKETRTGDTLAEKEHPVVFDPVTFPVPAISFAIEPKAKGGKDQQRDAAALRGGPCPQVRARPDDP